MEAQGKISIAQYLLIRLKELGIDHAFGVPGDYVLGFMNEMYHCKGKPHDISLVNTCNELNAAYAADGYARIKGAGCLITTYGVGELSAINGVAGSFAERVPVVAITGYPATELIKKQPLLHHTIGDYKKTKKMFKMITCASVLLKDAESAPKDIDRVLLEMKKHQRPVYIGLPCDLVQKPCMMPTAKIPYLPLKSDQSALSEAVNEAIEMLNKASKPIIIADVELHRYRLENKFKDLLEKSGMPFATLMMGKTLLDEEHPQFIGLYQGKSSRDYVKDRIENSDCVLMLGVVYSDLNTGNFSMNIDTNKSIIVNYNRTQVRHHFFENISLEDFITNLTEKVVKRDSSTMDIKKATEGCVHRKTTDFMPKLEDKLTVKRIFDRLAHFIPEKSIVVADTGVSLWASSEMLMPKGSKFIGQIFYGSIGYTIGAVIGICFAAPDRPVILFIGDGSFQETGQDLSTMIRYKLHPTIFLLNNDGYTIERAIVDGPFNDIQSWKYHQFPQVMGGSIGHDVHTEGQLEVALHHIQERKHLRLTMVELHTARNDCSEPLKKAGAAMAKENFISPVSSH